MGPRLGRVEYLGGDGLEAATMSRFNGATLRTRGILVVSGTTSQTYQRFNGATLRTRGIQVWPDHLAGVVDASMGPRLGRVEYFATCRSTTDVNSSLQWGHA